MFNYPKRSKIECQHNARSRYTNGFYCRDCNTFFDRNSPTYRSGELLSSIWMVLNNINVDSIRSNNGPIKEVILLKDKIGIGVKHSNYEELIKEAEILMAKYDKDSKSAQLVMQEKKV